MPASAWVSLKPLGDRREHADHAEGADADGEIDEGEGGEKPGRRRRLGERALHRGERWAAMRAKARGKFSPKAASA